ncbi:4Fe-4S dicluster domain-containing protein [Fervidicoccus fontis]|nr:4Fe-4S dicluster domain-containing protein [Fervidicoccus fontis]
MSNYMKFYVGGVSALEKLFLYFKSNGLNIYGPKKDRNSIIYGELNDFSQLCLSPEGISSKTPQSIKNIVHPSSQLFLKTKSDYSSYAVYDNESGDKVLFGIRPCDLNSLYILDKMLSEDPYYSHRRETIKGIVVQECTIPGKYCFCSKVGTGPNTESGFDISYAFIGEYLVVFKSGSKLGESVLSKLFLREANEEEVKLYNEKIKNAKDTIEKNFPLDVKDIEGALEKSINDAELWKEISKDCIGCSNCNMVCPTCTCTEFIDDIRMNGNAERKRIWVGCLSPVYGQIAGMHFRKEQYMRYRHFVLHKFLFSKKEIGTKICVGCGRCIAFCPLRLDLRKTLNSVVSIYGKK